MFAKFDRFLEAVERGGITLKRSGGEFFALDLPCHACGRDGATDDGHQLDRVRLFPVDEGRAGYRRGRWYCHHCQARGDGVDFLMRYCGMSFPDAFKAVTGENPPDRSMRQRTAGACRQSTLPMSEVATSPTSCGWRIRPNPNPCHEWSAQARLLAIRLDYRLTDIPPACMDEARKWIEQGRGIKLEWSPCFGVYWNPVDRFEPAAKWGLKRERKLFIPKGIVIAMLRRTLPPAVQQGWIVGLLVRRAEPSGEGDKLRWVPCRDDTSAEPKTRTLILGEAGRPVVITESALDAVLVYQEAGGSVAVVSTCGATYPLDEDVAIFMRRAPSLWAWPDADEAGDSAFQRWKTAFPSLKRINMPVDRQGRALAKDATELARLNGHDVPAVRQILQEQGVLNG